MNRLKRTVAMLIAAILVISLNSASIFAEPEVVEEKQGNTYEKLLALGILDEYDNVDLEATVTRKELAKVAMRLLGAPEMDDKTVGNLYQDVNAGNDYASYIVRVNQLGIMHGYGDGNFYPDVEVTRSQAAKVFTVLLGYGDIVKNEMGYIDRATRLGVFKKCSNGDVITWRDLLQMADNSLEIQLLDVIAYSNYATEYASQNNTLLSRYFDISILSGILEATPYTHLMSASDGCADYRVVISGTKLVAMDVDAEAYLGYSVKAYYKNNNMELVYAEPETDNDVIKVGYKDIVESKTTQTTFVYEVEAKIKTIDIDPAVIFLYNGKQCSLTVEKLCPSVGEVLLIDNDENGRVDVIHVTEYKALVADSINTTTGMIIGLTDGETVVLDEQNSDYGIEIIKNGEPASLDGIKRYDTVLYAESSGAGKNKIRVLVCDNTVQGEVTYISDDEVKIGDAFYELPTFVNVNIGEIGQFFIDAFGRVIGKKSEKDIVYGYLYAMREGNFEQIQLKIFTENNRWVTLTLKDKFLHNTVSGYSAKKFYDDLKDVEYQQLITYRVNPNYEVYELNTAQTSYSAWSEEEDMAINSNIFRLSRSYSNISYRSLPGILGGYELPLEDDTKLFMIPASEREEDYHVGNRSELLNDQSCTNVYAYDCDEYGVPKACVFNDYEEPLDDLSEIMVVKDVVQALNSNDEISYGIKGYYKNVEVTVTTADNSVVDSQEGIHFGSVIQFSMNQQGDVSKIDVLYNYSPLDETLSTTESLYSRVVFVKAEVFRVDSDQGRVILKLEDGSKAVMDVMKLLKSVYVCDENNKKIRVGSLEDLFEGQRIFANSKYGRAETIVVYE